MGMFNEKEKGTEPSVGDEQSPPRVETIQGQVKSLHWDSGKVSATIALNGDAGEIRINGKRFKVGESVKISISAEE